MISSRVELLSMCLCLSHFEISFNFAQACFFNIIKESFRILFSSSCCLCDLFINEQPSKDTGVEVRLEEVALSVF